MSSLSTLKCNKCGAELFVVNAELVKLLMGGPLQQLASSIGNRLVRNPNLIRVNHHAVVILFGCERRDCGERVPVNYGYGPDGVLVKKGYPQGKKDPFQPVIAVSVQPLTASHVAAIVDGMDWPGSDYRLLIRNCHDWARGFVAKLRAAKPGEVPLLVVRVSIVGQGTDEVLQDNMEMKFDGKVNVLQMATKALELSDLQTKGYKLDRVVRRIEIFGAFGVRVVEHVRVDLDASIVDGAVYKVVVRK